MTQSIESAQRIVTIAENLASPLSASRREKLVAEQRKLWDAEHEGRPFEAIEQDVWRYKSYG